MEGPSLVIATEEFAPFLKKRVSQVEGNSKIPLEKLEGSTFKKVQSWGKHFLMTFEIGKGRNNAQMNLRVHFLMFGSYRINDPRENRIPRLTFSVGTNKIYFYGCGIRVLEKEDLKNYDWSVDLLSSKWDHRQAIAAVKNKPEVRICDILMDQNIFAGLGNIIKNEVLYRLKLHPELKVKNLSPKQINNLVFEAHNYSHQFYEWKKLNQLKRHWLIFRKKDCPEKHGELIKEPTGKLERFSHYCLACQPYRARNKTSKKSKRLKRKAPAKKPEHSPRAHH